MSNTKDDNLRIGAGVWHIDYGNGRIINIDWEDRVVDVEFDYMSTITRQVIEIDELFGTWDDGLNQWVIPA